MNTLHCSEEQQVEAYYSILSIFFCFCLLAVEVIDDDGDDDTEM
jgi:hypothetical protein